MGRKIMSYVSESISNLQEIYSKTVNERVVTLGKIGTAGYYLVYYDKANPVHSHPDFSGTFLVVRGKGKILLGKDDYTNYKSGDVFTIQKNTLHQVDPSEPTLLLTILDPAPAFNTAGWENSECQE